MAEGSAEFTITVLGSGTSVGVPTVCCECAVCTSPDPRDNRLRPSILIQFDGKTVVVDTTPDFRTQVLRAKVRRVDAVLLTHAHADHIMGLDDIRPFNFRQAGKIPVYGSADTLEAVRRCFAYAFEQKNTHIPRVEMIPLSGEPFNLFGAVFSPVRLVHGSCTVLGFRFGAAAYLTDHNEIPDESLEKLQNLDVLFLDALRHRPHPTHTTVERALQYVEQLKPRRAFFTHICHDLSHARTEEKLPPQVRLAYDGMRISVGESRSNGG